jgi:hypothetical protein
MEMGGRKNKEKESKSDVSLLSYKVAEEAPTLHQKR